MKPFREITFQRLPTGSLKNKFKTSWVPFFKFVHSAIQLPPDRSPVDEQFILQCHSRVIAFLKERVSYVFETSETSRKGKNPIALSLSTWSNRVSRSAIMRHGNESDKALLSQPTPRNTSKPSNATRKRSLGTNVRYTRRQRQRQGRREASTSSSPDGDV